MAQQYDIEAVRRNYIGSEIAKARGRFPVEHDPIRRHCHMVDDNNPPFLDPEYAKATEHGTVLCPPAGWLALYFASLGLLIYAAAASIAAHVMIVRVEEPELRERFGESYEAYCRSVPRWLPRWPGTFPGVGKR